MLPSAPTCRAAVAGPWTKARPAQDIRRYGQAPPLLIVCSLECFHSTSGRRSGHGGIGVLAAAMEALACWLLLSASSRGMRHWRVLL